MRYETTVDIDASSDTVWQALIDVQSWPKWTESMHAVEWIAGTGVAVGSAARIKQPRMPWLVWTVSQTEPGVSFTWQATSPGVKTIGVHLVTPLAEGRSRLTLGIKQGGGLSWLVGALSGSKTKRFLRMEAEGLRKCAQEQAKNPASLDI